MPRSLPSGRTFPEVLRAFIQEEIDPHNPSPGPEWQPLSHTAVEFYEYLGVVARRRAGGLVHDSHRRETVACDAAHFTVENLYPGKDLRTRIDESSDAEHESIVCGFVNVTARNFAFDDNRRVWRYREPDPEWPNDDPKTWSDRPSVQARTTQHLRNTLKTLVKRDRNRQVVIRLVIDGASPAEVAGELGLTEENVRQLRRRYFTRQLGAIRRRIMARLQDDARAAYRDGRLAEAEDCEDAAEAIHAVLEEAGDR